MVDENSLPLSLDGSSKGNGSCNQLEDTLIDILGKEASIEDPVHPGEDCVTEIVENFVVVHGVLRAEKPPERKLTLSVGTMCTFRLEGSLFPGKILCVAVAYPWYTIVTMAKSIDRGWVWPEQRDTTNCKEKDIIGTIETKNVTIIGQCKYKIDDDLLYMECGE